MAEMSWFEFRINVGNIIAVLTTLSGLVWMIAEMRQNEALANQRIVQIEQQVKTRDLDHDILIEMRGDIKLLKQGLDRLDRIDRRTP
jgi:hypothetical protein